ncbi:MAG TPA: glycosyltransferase, partial [Longimicrobiaceae bacterium]
MTRGTPLVSIVVNNHDYAAFLPAAVESALAQSHPRVEVVVVDDGSTDGSREVIRGFGDRVVAVLKPNGGQASAFNAGFRATRGELVHFLDADDSLDPRCAERVVDAWGAREGLSKLHFFLRIVDGAGRATGKAKPLYTERLPDGDVRPELAGSGGYVSPPTSGNVFARSFLERVMPVPEEDFRICADSYL